MKPSRQFTTEEVRENFLRHAATLSRYWATLDGKTDSEKCHGVVFSLLCLLDGCSVGMPGFAVVPSPHPDDQKYLESENENWYPTSPPSEHDIAGGLHEIYHKFK